jgi:predicted O-methyltransferase YrrM
VDGLVALKAELEAYGEVNDAAVRERSRRMLNISRETGQFLAVLVRATKARHVLEIGTSNGYSTLWLAEAARANDGAVTTVEASEYKAGLASANFRRAGLSSSITLLRDDAGVVLQGAVEGAFDFIFLDAERSEYPGWWPHIRQVLRPGGLLAADNAVSHAEQMAPFVALVSGDPTFATCVVQVGKGELLAVKTP